MEYTKMYLRLKTIFNLKKESMDIPDSNLEIRCFPFTSLSKIHSLLLPSPTPNNSLLCNQSDYTITENQKFVYPVFVPKGRGSFNRSILLLHGLNERSWEKYLPWAFYLATKTGQPVILFPISFHMNRAPEQWGNPRTMLNIVKQRKMEQNNPLPFTTFANIALSERLLENPLRFFTSGHQTAEDLIQLIHSIRNGAHPLFEKNTTTDIFAYSIGAFLSEILFLANPENLFETSRLFMFCGGSVFSRMNGTSKLIMNEQAFNQMIQYYVRNLNEKLQRMGVFSEYLNKTTLGKAFHAMLATENLRNYRENMFFKFQKQIHTIGLMKDLVIPAQGIWETLCSWNKSLSGTVEFLDLPYSYSHESPFPVNNIDISTQVNQAFLRVFDSAAKFLG